MIEAFGFSDISSFIFSFFMASFFSAIIYLCVSKIFFLKDRPYKRATLTAFATYTLSIWFFISAGIDQMPTLAAIIFPAVVSLILYMVMISHYKKSWIDDDKISDGMLIENDDWKVGAVQVVGGFVILLGAALGGKIIPELISMIISN